MGRLVDFPAHRFCEFLYLVWKRDCRYIDNLRIVGFHYVGCRLLQTLNVCLNDFITEEGADLGEYAVRFGHADKQFPGFPSTLFHFIACVTEFIERLGIEVGFQPESIHLHTTVISEIRL